MQYPTIAQPQYGFAPTMPMMPSMSDMPPAMMNFKKGGLASLSLPEMAERVEAAGRNGDTMLAHITPEEAGILQLLGGSGTINPHTGQPEYFKKFFKKILSPVKSVAQAVAKVAAPVIRPLAPLIPFMNFIPGVGPLSSLAVKSMLTGIASGLDKKGNFDFKRGLKAGALAYGIGSLMQGAQAQGSPNAAGTGGPYDISDVGSLGDLTSVPTPAVATPTINAPAGYDFGAYSSGDIGYDFGGAGTPSIAPPAPAPAPVSAPVPAAAPPAPPSINYTEPGASPATVTQSINPAATGLPAPPPPPTFMESATKYVSDIPSKLNEGIKSLPGKALDFAKELPSNVTDFVLDPKNIPTNILIGTQVAAGVQAKKELDRQKAEAERVLAEQEKYTQEEIAFAQDVMRRYPIEYRRLSAEDVESQNLAGGGLAGLNAFKAGGEPRFLKGGGDGMSDDIPATIGGRQKARLSDGEFVIPADVVSHLGNGSSRAGAKKLYSMMDNIRKARTGRARQSPQVKAERYMPA